MGKGFAKQKKQMRLLQQQVSRMQEDMQSVQVTGSAPNNLVTITLNGEHKIVALKIDPSCIDPQDAEGLEDLICVAYADALQQLQSQQQMPDVNDLLNLT